MGVLDNLIGQFQASSKKSFAPARLIRLDEGDPGRIDFQFGPESFTKTISSTYASGTTMNRAHPILQFNSGDLEEISFSARFFSRHGAEDVQPYLDALSAATRRDINLGRPPIWAFLWGVPIADTVIVKSISPISFDSLKPDGSIRDIGFSITLQRYEQYDIELTDPNERPKDTFYKIVQTGDTWESLAAQQYGDPMKGELLRRLNPSRPYLVVGERMKLLDSDKLDGVIVTPESPPLERTAAGFKVTQELFALRGASKRSHVLKR